MPKQSPLTQNLKQVLKTFKERIKDPNYKQSDRPIILSTYTFGFRND